MFGAKVTRIAAGAFFVAVYSENRSTNGKRTGRLEACCADWNREGTGYLATARTTQIDNTKIDTVAITRLAYTMRSCRRPRRAASA